MRARPPPDDDESADGARPRGHWLDGDHDDDQHADDAVDSAADHAADHDEAESASRPPGSLRSFSARCRDFVLKDMEAIVAWARAST